MKRMITGIFAVAMMVVVLAGCKVAPTAQKEAAQAALDSARVLEADRYFAAEFVVLEDSLNVAISNLEAQNALPSGQREFGPIADVLEWVTAEADTLILNVEARKAEVQAEVESGVAALTQSVEASKVALAATVKTARNRAALEAKQSEITVLESSVAEINTLVANGDFLTAHEKVTAAIEKATALQAQLAVN